MSFSSVVGNERIKRILGKALAGNRFPNSVLFIGPEGTGKKTMALEVAKALNCEREGVEACDECSACRAIMRQEDFTGYKSQDQEGGKFKPGEKKGLFPDVMVIAPIKDVIKIEEIRILKQAAFLRPMIGRKRIFIIDQAEKMNTEASNSILKVLEEPPDFFHIILLTSNPFLILPTIQSRCQFLKFSRISREEIERDLREQGLAADQARVLAQIVRGNLRKAREMDWNEVQIGRQKAWNLLLALWGRAPASPHLQAFFNSRDRAKDQLPETLEILTGFLRDIILLNEGGDRAGLMNPDFEPKLLELAADLNLDRALDFLQRIDYALYALKRNCNVNLVVSSFFSHVMEWKYV